MQKLLTAAGENLAGQPWNSYPRPRMVREDWLCLNGEWAFSIGQEKTSIRVPFCPESQLSGVELTVPYGEEMTYRREFTLPEHWQGKRILLHFGAVSRIAVVRLNGRTAAVHEESYLPFTADVTDLVRPGVNELTVLAINDISHKHPWGKQKRGRGGMWYTPVSGIWQTVWLEAVPEHYIRSLTVRTGRTYADVTVEGVSDGVILMGGQEFPLQDGFARLIVPDPIPWSPENPHLYRFTVVCGADRVESYFALRTLSVETVGGIPRLCLNGEPYFFHGILDQGYWSDGLYTPASPACFEEDILAMKALGFNTLRKHVKIEPELYYYACDRLGMIVFQDMVNCGEYRYLRDTLLPTLGFTRRTDETLNRDTETRRNFLAAMDATVKLLQNHPCICLWTVFNEGWGQFRADEVFRRLRSMDDTRFINTASGWFRQNESDVESQHNYFHKLRLGPPGRPQLRAEFGGWSYKLPKHSFNLKKTYGYRKFNSRGAFVRRLRRLYLEKLVPLTEAGLCGAIYTQVSDVEDETNGLLTFDRRVSKLLPEEFADIAPALQAAVHNEQ